MISGSINISDPIKLSQGLIRFNTINPPGNEDELGNYLTGLLESAGFECMDVDFAPRRRSIVGRIAGVARKLHNLRPCLKGLSWIGRITDHMKRYMRNEN